MMITSALSLFGAAFLAATLLPAASELFFVRLVVDEPEHTWLWWLVASFGNSLGGVATLLLGTGIAYMGTHWHWAKRLRIQIPSEGALTTIERYGIWVLLGAWLPVVGDLLCLAAGILRWSKWQAIALITIGKSARYGVLALIVS